MRTTVALQGSCRGRHANGERILSCYSPRCRQEKGPTVKKRHSRRRGWRLGKPGREGEKQIKKEKNDQSCGAALIFHDEGDIPGNKNDGLETNRQTITLKSRQAEGQVSRKTFRTGFPLYLK